MQLFDIRHSVVVAGVVVVVVVVVVVLDGKLRVRSC